MTNRAKQLVKQKQKQKQRRRFWQREIFRDRKLYSDYYTVYQKLRQQDREYHYKYLRMTKKRVDHLLGMVRDKITKKDTQLREAISAEERRHRFSLENSKSLTFCHHEIMKIYSYKILS